MSSTSGRFTLRPATNADLEFVYAAREEAFRRYVDLLFGGWDDSSQREEFETSFVPARAWIIEVHGTAIGYLELVEDGERTRIKTIVIVRTHRRAGIGSAVVAHVARNHERVVLRVLKANAQARRLYERLGFAIVGESEHHWWEMHLRRE